MNLSSVSKGRKEVLSSSSAALTYRRSVASYEAVVDSATSACRHEAICVWTPRAAADEESASACGVLPAGHASSKKRSADDEVLPDLDDDVGAGVAEPAVVAEEGSGGADVVMFPRETQRDASSAEGKLCMACSNANKKRIAPLPLHTVNKLGPLLS